MEKQNFPILPVTETIEKEIFSTHTMENKPEEYKPTGKLNMDQTNKQTKIFHII